MFNANNRQGQQIRIGAVAASKEYLAIVATKKIRVYSAKLTDLAAIGASNADYLEYKLKKNTADVATKVDTKAGLAALVGKALTMPTAGYVDLAKGDNLTLDIVKAGNGAGTEMLLSLDVEVIGN